MSDFAEYGQSKTIIRVSVLLLICLLVMQTGMALAGTSAPTSGDFYEVYDRLMHGWLGGAVGWIAVALSTVFGVILLIRGQWMPAIISLLAGVVIFRLEAVVASLALTI